MQAPATVEQSLIAAIKRIASAQAPTEVTGTILKSIRNYEDMPKMPTRSEFNDMPTQWEVNKPAEALILLDRLINHNGARAIIHRGLKVTITMHQQYDAMLEQCKLFDEMLAQVARGHSYFEMTTIATRRDQLRLLLDQIEPPTPPTYDELVSVLADAVSSNTLFNVHAAREMLARVSK